MASPLSSCVTIELFNEWKGLEQTHAKYYLTTNNNLIRSHPRVCVCVCVPGSQTQGYVQAKRDSTTKLYPQAVNYK